MKPTSEWNKPMRKQRRYVVSLPLFPGFGCESWLSGAIDAAVVQDAELRARRESQERYPKTYHPEHLRLDAEEYRSIYLVCTDFQKIRLRLAKCWVEAFDWWCAQNLGTPEKSFTWKSMESPQDYNFDTDRVFAYVPPPVVEMLFARSEALEHKMLAKVFKDNCTESRFRYSNGTQLKDLLERPLSKWDHNEMRTLIAADIQSRYAWKDIGDFSPEFYDLLFSSYGDEDEACAVDWEMLDTKAAELRAEKLEEYNALTSK